MNYKVGMSIGSDIANYDRFTELKASGIDAMELCGRTDFDGYDFDAVRRAADKAGICLWSLHSHMRPDFDVSSLDTQSNKLAIGELSDLINRASAYGIDKFVIHPTHTPEPFDQAEREEKIKRAMYCLDILAEYAATKGSVVAVENLPRTCLANTVEEHIKILSANDKLCACFDFNHSLIDDTADVIRRLGKRIVTVHVSDRDNINERHWVPGEGVLNWPEIMAAFNEIGYTGAWIYELGLDAPPTIDRRPLTYKDFAENAATLFKGEAPKPIGTPKPRLGLWAPIED